MKIAQNVKEESFFVLDNDQNIKNFKEKLSSSFLLEGDELAISCFNFFV